jgi:hypothetical protein
VHRGNRASLFEHGIQVQLFDAPADSPRPSGPASGIKRTAGRVALPNNSNPTPLDTQLFPVAAPASATCSGGSCGLDGSNAVRLTSLEALSYAPRWFPDGRRLVFIMKAHKAGRSARFSLLRAAGDQEDLCRTSWTGGKWTRAE